MYGTMREITFAEIRKMDVASINDVFGGTLSLPGEVMVSFMRMNDADVRGYEIGHKRARCVIEDFVRAVLAMTDAQRRQLLRFWTGAVAWSDAHADPTLMLRLVATSSKGRLPTSQTCFRCMFLPVATDGSIAEASRTALRNLATAIEAHDASAIME
jgi:hypothetical protein